MPDNDKLYDIFIIFHPKDLLFVRRLDGHLKARDKRNWISWDDLSATVDGQTIIRGGILRSHMVAIALSPHSAESQVLNEQIQFAVSHNKRFISLILDEDIEVDVHPAIATNPYIYFRASDNFDNSVERLTSHLVVDEHVRLHSDLLVRAYEWDSHERSAGFLLPSEGVTTAREWLAQGATRQPKPSELQVEYIHASRRGQTGRRRNVGAYLVLIAIIIGLVLLLMGLFRQVNDSQSLVDTRGTEVAIQAETSDANANRASEIANTATAGFSAAENLALTATAVQVLAQSAVDSAMTADFVQRNAQQAAQNAIAQAAIALTAQEQAQATLALAEQESDNAATLSAQVMTAKFESDRLVETASAAQGDSLNQALTATAIKLSADERGILVQTQVAQLSTASADATLQFATLSALQVLSENNAQLAENAVAQLETVNATATQTANIDSQARVQSLVVSAEQALNAGDVDLVLALAFSAAELQSDAPQVYGLLSRAADLAPSLVLNDVATLKFNPRGGEFAVLPRSLDEIQIYRIDTRQLVRTMKGHDDLITTMEYSRDGFYLVTASEDGTLIVWNAASGDPLNRLQAHNGIVNAIAMHPDNERMVSAGINPMLVMWNLRTGEEITRYVPFDRNDQLLPNQMIFSASGERLIAWSNPRAVPIMSQWRADNLESIPENALARFYEGLDPTDSVAWTGGHSLPAFADDPNVGELVFWDVDTGRERTRLSEGFNWSLISGASANAISDTVLFVAFKDEGETALVAVESSDGSQRAVLVNTADGTILRSFQNSLMASLTSARFIASDTLISTTIENQVILWSAETGRLIREIGVSTRALQNITLSPDQSQVIVQASGGISYLWSLADDDPALLESLSAVSGTTMNPAGDRLIVAQEDRVILSDSRSSNTITIISDSTMPTLSNDGSQFALIIGENRLALFNTDSGERLLTRNLPTETAIQEIAISTPASAIAVLDADGAVWLGLANQPIYTGLLAADVSGAFEIGFSPDGQYLASSHPESVILWEVASGAEVRRFPLGLPLDESLAKRVQVKFSADNRSIGFFVQVTDTLGALTWLNLENDEVLTRQTLIDVSRGMFSADGQYLLLALTDNSIQVLDSHSGEVIRRLVGHEDEVLAMVYLPQENWLFSGGDDNSLLQWNVTSGNLIQQYRHPDKVLSFVVSADGKRVLSRAGDGVYRLWQQESLSDLIERVQSRFTLRELTCSEREFYNVLPLCG